VLYRPPPSKKNGLTKAMFFDEFSEYLNSHVLSTGKIILLGDFNFHWEDQADPDTVKLKQILDSCCFQQHVVGNTHLSNHTLDLVLSRTTDDIVISTEVSSLISDHHAVHCTLALRKPPLPRHKIVYRKLKTIDHEQFKSDLQNSSLIVSPEPHIDDLLVQYDTTLIALLDKHCPEKTKMITVRPVVKWYTPEIAAAKKQRSKYEQLWRRTGLTVHREAYKQERNNVNALVVSAKKSFYNAKIHDCNDQKALFKFVNSLLGKNGASQLPDHSSVENLLQLFSDYFETKIAKIRSDLEIGSSNLCAYPPIQVAQPSTILSTFDVLSESQVRKLISSAPPKSCKLDPIPTCLLKEYTEELAKPITSIINKSLSSGVVPADMKKALVNPLIKKPTLDPDNLKNYRPVSNLTFLSKLVEKAVDAQVSNHMDVNGLFPVMQSAYRPKHSVETALVKVQNDILLEIDQSKGVIMVLLDNSAAFDTLDHDLLQQCMSDMGIKDTALNWFSSYLSDRYQSITLQNMVSSPVSLRCGVPQGSVFGPKSFLMLTRAVERIAALYGVSVHLYADDTQLYVSFDLDDPDALAAAKLRLEKCISHIAAWMKENKLKLNEEKTEVIAICHPRQRHKLKDCTIHVGSAVITPAPTARNLGVMFDQDMSLAHQVTSICRSANYHLRNIGKIRKYLTKESAETIIHALITSRVDNNNALLAGLPDTQINRLLKLQRTAGRIILCVPKFEPVSTLSTLHWLPIRARITFKILLLVFKSLHGLGPKYLSDLLRPYKPTRSLRSQQQDLLQVPKARLVTGGDRAFAVIGPKLWNSLPQDIKESNTVNTFKMKLKTFLFEAASKE
jgi:hypothetical protein